jgi:hypothetical protein
MLALAGGALLLPALAGAGMAASLLPYEFRVDLTRTGLASTPQQVTASNLWTWLPLAALLTALALALALHAAAWARFPTARLAGAMLVLLLFAPVPQVIASAGNTLDPSTAGADGLSVVTVGGLLTNAPGPLLPGPALAALKTAAVVWTAWFAAAAVCALWALLSALRSRAY